MNIVICSWCFVEKKDLIRAIEVIPEIRFGGKKKLEEIGICADHKAVIFPESFFQNAKGLRPGRKKRSDSGDESPAVRRRKHSDAFKRKVVRRVLAGEQATAVAREYGIGSNLIRRWDKKLKGKIAK